MSNWSSDHIFRIVLGILAAASLSGIGYLTLVVIQLNHVTVHFLGLPEKDYSVAASCI